MSPVVTDKPPVDMNDPLATSRIEDAPGYQDTQVDPSSANVVKPTLDAESVNKMRALAAAILKKVDPNANIDTLTTDQILDLPVKAEGIPTGEEYTARRILRVYVGAREADFSLSKTETETFNKHVDLIDYFEKTLQLSSETGIGQVGVHVGHKSGAELKASLSGVSVLQGATGSTELLAKLADKKIGAYDQLAEHIPAAADIIAPAAKKVEVARKAHDAALKTFQEEEVKYNNAVTEYNKTDGVRNEYYLKGLAAIPGADKISLKVQETQEDGSIVEKSVTLKEHIDQTIAKVQNGDMTVDQALAEIETVSNAAHDAYYNEIKAKVASFESQEEADAFLKAEPQASLLAAHDEFDVKFSELIQNQPAPLDPSKAPSREAFDLSKANYEIAVTNFSAAVDEISQVDNALIEAAKTNQVLAYALESKTVVQLEGGQQAVHVTILSPEDAKFYYGALKPYMLEFQEDATLLDQEMAALASKVSPEIMALFNAAIEKGKNGIATDTFDKSFEKLIDLRQMNDLIKAGNLDKETAELVRRGVGAVNAMYGARKVNNEERYFGNMYRMADQFYQEKEKRLASGKLKDPNADSMFVGTWKQGNTAGYGQFDKWQNDEMKKGYSAFHALDESYRRQLALTAGIDRRRWSYMERPFVAAGKENVGTIFRNVVVPHLVGQFIPGFKIKLPSGGGVIGGGGGGGVDGF